MGIARQGTQTGEPRRAAVIGVVLGCLVCQLGLGFGYVLSPLLPDILAELGWSRATFSAARAPQIFVIAAASPIVGALTIRYGARPILLIAIAILGLSFLGISRMQGVFEFSLLVAVWGLSVAGLGDITVGQLVSQWVRRARGLALGIVYTGSNLGGVLLVSLAVPIADSSDWRDALALMGVLAFVVMGPIAFWLARERAPVATADTEADETRAAITDESDRDLDVGAALRTRTFWILAFSLFAFFFYFLGLLEHFVLFLTDEGMERKEAAGYFRNALAMGMVSKIVLGAIADRIPHRVALLADYVLLALSSLLLLLLPDSTLLWLFVGCYGFATAARDVVYPLIVSDCFGLRYMAKIYGCLMLTLLPGGTLGPIFAAAVHDHFGSYRAAFVTMAALNVAAVAALHFVRDERPPGPDGAARAEGNAHA